MEKYIYQELYELENKHWWFVSKKNIVIGFIKKYLHVSKENKILDVGCGSGLMLNDLTGFGTVCGMDSSDEAIKFSKLVFNGEVKEGYIPGRIPYPEKHFDLILALDVLEHLEDDVKSIDDIKAHLNDNGICIITVPAYMFLWSYHDKVHEHKRRYTSKELYQKLRAAGFNILKLSYYNTLLFLPILLLRTVNKIFKRESGSDAKMPNRYLNYMLQKVFTFECSLLKFFNMGFGVSIIAVVKNQ